MRKMKKLEFFLIVLVYFCCAFVTIAEASEFQVVSDFLHGGDYGFHGENVAYKSSTDWYVKIKNIESGQTVSIDWVYNDVVDLSASYVTAMDSGPGSPGHIWAAQINPDGSLASDIFYMPVPSQHGSWAPSIYDNSIVWMDGRNGQWEIFMATLDGDQVGPEDVRQLTDNEASNYNNSMPRIYGDNVFWQTLDSDNRGMRGQALYFALDMAKVLF